MVKAKHDSDNHEGPVAEGQLEEVEDAQDNHSQAHNAIKHLDEVVPRHTEAIFST